MEASSRSRARKQRRPSAAVPRRDGKLNRTKQSNIADEEASAAAAVASASSAAMPAAEEEVTSAPVVVAAKEHAPIAIRSPLPTPRITPPSLVDPVVVPNVHAAAGKIIKGPAKFVLGLSYVHGTLLKRCSGFLMDWSENTKSGTVFTSAHLICSSSAMDEWSGGQEHAPDAEVRVHLDDDLAVRGQLVYYHKHYGFALISAHMEGKPDVLARFSSEEVRLAQDVFVLGRDENFYFRMSNGRVNYEGPSLNERYHYMYIKGGEYLRCFIGGPVVDFDGVVVGMKSLSGFIPYSVLNKCLHLWRRLGCVPRLHLGLKLSTLKFFDWARAEKICRVSKLADTGLVVQEVSVGSIAGKHGVREGDIIESLNGRCVDTTAALEDALMSVCVDHFDKGHGLDSSMDVTVGLFSKCAGVHGTIKFTANASNDVEVFAKGKYTVSDDEDLSTSMSFDEANEV